MRIPWLTLLVGLSGLVGSVAGEPQRRVTVEAGDWDRGECVVSFAWEGPVGEGRWELRSGDGLRRAVQVGGGRGWFLEADLPRGAMRTYALVRVLGEGGGVEAVRLERSGERLTLARGMQPVLGYRAGAGELPRPEIREVFRRGGYLHPVHTPSGRVVTDDYPRNHIHHHGIWWSWTRTEFKGRRPDFWNMGESKGRTDFEALEGTEAGPVFAGFRSRQVMTDVLVTPPEPALREWWTVRVYAVSTGFGGFLWDLESRQETAGGEALRLPRYYYGGLGFRGPWGWNGPGAMRYLDSNGVTNRVAANQTRARWYWVGGEVDGALAGLAVLGHPDNFRSPQPLRVHPGEPFVCWAPSQLGDWSIEPGKPLETRYRVLAMDGEPDPARLERLWRDFAQPPRVRVEGAVEGGEPAR